MTSILPTENNVPVVGIPKEIKLLLEGPGKVGITTFGASFPKAILLEMERGGADHVGTCPVLHLWKGQDPLKGLRMAMEELRTDTRFGTVVLDTIDEFADITARSICDKLGIMGINEPPKNKRDGVQWDMYSNDVTGILGALIALPKNVVILGHTKPATYDREGKLKKQESLDIYGKASRIAYTRIDNIGRLRLNNVGGKTETVLSFRATTESIRGSRHPALRDREIVIPRDNGYAAFEKLFTEAN